MKYGKRAFDKDNDCKPAHSSLTGVLRRYWSPNIARYITTVIEKCNVSNHVGQLPPQLREFVEPTEIPKATQQFCAALDNFVNKKYTYICEACYKNKIYPMPEIEQIFGTKCVIEVNGEPVGKGLRPYEGSLGFVCKVVFPDVELEYALKLFYKKSWAPEYGPLHGALAEIAAAFGANQAEPRDNNPIYLARLTGNKKYMLSQWVYEAIDLPMMRKNVNQIFETSLQEQGARNWHAGRRIDYGGTYKTKYGMAPYPVRKLYRKMVNAANKNDNAAMQRLREDAVGYIAKQQFNAAIKCVCDMARPYYNCDLYNFVSSYRIRQK